jgi:predicted DNA-binding transcriptional regulator AlpA
MTALRPDPLSYPPRGMSRDEAARYIGVGATKFDEMVADRRMPRPKRVDGRVIWDRLKIEAAFTDLPEEKKVNPFDRAFGFEP